jgi:hypothetical protein
MASPWLSGGATPTATAQGPAAASPGLHRQFIEQGTAKQRAMASGRDRPGNLQRSCVMRQHRPLLFSLLIDLAVPSMAGAQSPQPTLPLVTHPPMAPPSGSTPPPEQIASPDHAPATGNTTLSERLSRQ